MKNIKGKKSGNKKLSGIPKTIQEIIFFKLSGTQRSESSHICRDFQQQK